MRIKRTLAGTAIAALALTTLAACGDDGDNDSDGSSGGGDAQAADIRVWLNGTDTPQEARDWLKKTFEEQNEGSTLTIEQQEWDGLVEKLTTSLASESETPDVVEIGNTQAPTFTAAGAFSDLTDQLDDLGGGVGSGVHRRVRHGPSMAPGPAPDPMRNFGRPFATVPPHSSGWRNWQTR